MCIYILYNVYIQGAEVVYRLTCSYLELSNRTEVLNTRVDMVRGCMCSLAGLYSILVVACPITYRTSIRCVYICLYCSLAFVRLVLHTYLYTHYLQSITSHIYSYHHSYIHIIHVHILQLRELLAVLQQREDNSSAVKLEWIVIWLIGMLVCIYQWVYECVYTVCDACWYK